MNPYHDLNTWKDPELLRTGTLKPGVYFFNRIKAPAVPIWALTSEEHCGAPHERKVFKRIEFHGSGTIFVRILVDGKFISEAEAIATETPSHDRAINVPRGTKGYSIQFEISGIFELDLIEIGFEPLPRTS